MPARGDEDATLTASRVEQDAASTVSSDERPDERVEASEVRRDARAIPWTNHRSAGLASCGRFADSVCEIVSKEIFQNLENLVIA